MAVRANNLRVVERTSYYRWIEGEADPDLRYICDLIIREGLSPSEIVDEVERISDGSVRISYMTIFNWLEGKTKRPQNRSLTWVGRALGLERRWVEAAEETRH
jgi:IS30 family transposase